MSWRDRILDDGTDIESWMEARELPLTATDAKGFARLSSVPRYVAAKLQPSSFGGNELTRSGHRWEEMILAYTGVPGNTALVHAPGNSLYACTPDGVDDSGQVVIAEAKTRHGKIMPFPDAGEWRQLAWQLMCVAEAEQALFGTLTVLRGENGEWEAREGGYEVLVVTREHPRIVAATEQIMPIAAQVLAALEVARQELQEVGF